MGCRAYSDKLSRLTSACDPNLMQACCHNQTGFWGAPREVVFPESATISSVPSIGAKNSVGCGGSPLVQILRLAWTYAPTPGKVQGQGGGWRDESISGCGLARDHTPRPGLKQALVAAKGLH